MTALRLQAAATPMRLSPTPSRRPSPPRNWEQRMGEIAIGGMLASCLVLAPVSQAAAPRFPPLSNDPGRCDRGFVGNTIGQANAVSDTVLDLRQCEYKGKQLEETVLSGALLQDADFSGSNMEGVIFSKAFAMGTNFEGADLTNAVLDRANFSEANLKDAKLVNSVITGTIFEGANLTNVNFEDALVGIEDVKRICQNPTLVGDSRVQIGCRQ